MVLLKPFSNIYNNMMMINEIWLKDKYFMKVPKSAGDVAWSLVAWLAERLVGGDEVIWGGVAAVVARGFT